MTFIGRFNNPAIFTLTDAATIAVDASKGPNFKVTLGASRTLGNPTNNTAVTHITIMVSQDGTGGWTLAFDTDWIATDPSVAINTTLNTVSTIKAEARDFSGGIKWYYTVIHAAESGVTDADAIHDNVAAEISAITEKVTPISADLILIEDSAAANAKKRVQIGNLPASSPLTTKGDLFTYTTAAARLGVGTKGQIITADPAEASGIKWTPNTNLESIPTFIYDPEGTASGNIYTSWSTMITAVNAVSGLRRIHVILQTTNNTLTAGTDFTSNTTNFNDIILTGRAIDRKANRKLITAGTNYYFGQVGTNFSLIKDIFLSISGTGFGLFIGGSAASNPDLTIENTSIECTGTANGTSLFYTSASNAICNFYIKGNTVFTSPGTGTYNSLFSALNTIANWLNIFLEPSVNLGNDWLHNNQASSKFRVHRSGVETVGTPSSGSYTTVVPFGADIYLPTIIFDPESSISSPGSNVYTTWAALATAAGTLLANGIYIVYIILNTQDHTVSQSSTNFTNAIFRGRPKDRALGYSLRFSSSNQVFSNNAGPLEVHDLSMKAGPSTLRFWDYQTAGQYSVLFNNATFSSYGAASIYVVGARATGVNVTVRLLGDTTMIQGAGSTGVHRLFNAVAGALVTAYAGPNCILGDSTTATFESTASVADDIIVYHESGTIIDHTSAADGEWTSIFNGEPKIKSTTRKTATFLARSGNTHLVSTSGGAVTANLPPAAQVLGRIGFKLTAAGNNLTIDGNGAETIDGATTLVLSTAGNTVVLESDGVEWHMLENLPGGGGGGGGSYQFGATDTLFTSTLTEVIVGGFYLDPTVFPVTTVSFRLVGNFATTDTGGSLELRLYDMGPGTGAFSPVRRSTVSIAYADRDKQLKVDQVLGLVSSPAADSNDIHDTARVYEVRAYLNVTTGTPTGYVAWGGISGVA